MATAGIHLQHGRSCSCMFCRAEYSVSAIAVLGNASPLVLEAPLSWRALLETSTTLHTAVRFHRTDDTVGEAVIYFAPDGLSVVSAESPSETDLRELAEDVERYKSGRAPRYLEAK